MKVERYIREYANAEKKNGKEWMTKEDYNLYCKRIEEIINVRERGLITATEAIRLVSSAFADMRKENT